MFLPGHPDQAMCSNPDSGVECMTVKPRKHSSDNNVRADVLCSNVFALVEVLVLIDFGLGMNEWWSPHRTSQMACFIAVNRSFENETSCDCGTFSGHCHSVRSI